MNLTDQRFLRRIGDRIRERRIARGWTQDELGEKCELHRTFIGSVERGERNVSILNLRVIAVALRIALAELFADQSAK
jgi:transcriptional regulator with XRE-family HTH domain